MPSRSAALWVVLLGSAALLCGCGPSMPRNVGPAMPITAPAEPFTHETGIQFVILPAGRVTSRLSDIELRRALLMSACEVTNAQYEKFVPDHKRTKTSPGDNQPVSNVTGEEAEAFCRWLTKSDPLRRKYRLPDQAEWEYAARGGRDNLLYPWGDDIDESRACYGAQGTKPVGSYPPNRFGLFDVAGNVGEWVIRDDFPPYELRGGSWRDVDGAALRIMAREAPPQKNLELDHHGFRVLCEPPALAR